MAGIHIDWNKVLAMYLKGGTTVRMIAEKVGLTEKQVAQRIYRKKWHLQRRAMLSKIEAKLVTKAVISNTDKASQWAENQWNRCQKLRGKVDETIEQIGGPIDPLALDQITKAEVRIDDMGRRSLGMVEPRAVDITSGGMPLGDFQAAMRSVTALCEGRKNLTDGLDVRAIAEAEIIEEGATTRELETAASEGSAD